MVSERKALLTESIRSERFFAVTDPAEMAFDKALAACAETADTSFDVTEPAASAEILLESTLIIDCIPCVDTSPADRALIAERSTETADHTEAMFEFAWLSAFDTILAALLAAFATLKAFDAAVETILAAFDAAFATLRAFDAAVETVEIADNAAEILFDSALTMLWTPWVDTSPIDLADTPLRLAQSALRLFDTPVIEVPTESTRADNTLSADVRLLISFDKA